MRRKRRRTISRLVLLHNLVYACGIMTLNLEQKRRQAIREGFDRLTELVPGLEGQGRSENIVLSKTVIYMKDQIEERKRLVAQVEALGGKVDESLKR